MRSTVLLLLIVISVFQIMMLQLTDTADYQKKEKMTRYETYLTPSVMQLTTISLGGLVFPV